MTVERTHRWSGLKLLGISLVIVGIVSAVLLAYLGNSKAPPAASTQALIALVSIVAQVAAAFAFSNEGKPDPSHSQRSVARLYGLLARAETARVMAEALYEGGFAPRDVRMVNGQLSTHLSYLEEGYSDAIEDWRVFNPVAVIRAVSSATKKDEETT